MQTFFRLRAKRERFEGHAKYPRQALLIDSHEAFCRHADDILARIDILAGKRDMKGRTKVRLLGHTSRRFDDWLWAMRSHERYEENKLYPYLEMRSELDLSPLVSGHQRLHELADATQSAFSQRAEGDSEPQWTTLRTAAQAFVDQLVDHLIDEEGLVIPPLLELTDAEFLRYRTSTLSELRT